MYKVFFFQFHELNDFSIIKKIILLTWLFFSSFIEVILGIIPLLLLELKLIFIEIYLLFLKAKHGN